MSRPTAVLPVRITDRLQLQPMRFSDADELVTVFQDPDVRRYLLDDTLVTAEWVREEVAASMQRFAESGTGLWVMRLKSDNSIIGFVGFREFFDPPQLQLLYGLLPSYWRQGLATEAATRVCEYAFHALGFDEIRAATDVPNRASVKVLEGLGMRRLRVSDEGPAGTLFYAVSRDEWTATRGESTPE